MTAELLRKYPNKVPIVCQRAVNSRLSALIKDKCDSSC